MNDQPIIRNKDELLGWIEGHPVRHVQTGTHSCLCGWEPKSTDPRTTPSWQEHFDAMLFVDLGDVLPSQSYRDGEPEAWGPLVTSLYEAIDWRDRNCTCGWVDE